MLTGMEGKLWIDKQTFQWVKVEATVIRPVSIGGFLAEVEPGTHFELVEDASGRQHLASQTFCNEIAGQNTLLFTRKSQADEVYYGYHKPAPIKAVAAER